MSNYSTISIDKLTKDRATKRAKKDRITISAITRILLNDYADGKIAIGSKMVVTENGFTPEFEDLILKAGQEESSKSFSTADEAIAFLHKESKRSI